MRHPICAVLLSTCLAACGGSSSDRAATPQRVEPVTEVPTPAEDTLGSRPAPEATDAEIAELVRRSNQFAFEMYRRARPAAGNAIMSPTSAHIALAMTSVGARGQTAAELERALHLDGLGEAAHRSAGKLMAGWNAERQTYTLRVANRIFAERSFVLETPFVESLATNYRAPVEQLDFRGSPDPSRVHINQWISEATNARIPELLGPGTIDTDTRIVLTNAVYFLGEWESQFEREATANDRFFAPNGERNVPTMHQMERLGYAEIDGAKALELRYRSGDMSIVFVLPNDRNGLHALEERLDSALFDRITGGVTRQEVRVALPKVELDSGEMHLVPALRQLGIAQLFDEAHADLSGIAPIRPDERLVVSDVIQKAFVRIDERGTEAAAATAVVIEATSAAMPDPEPPKEFIADHPFLFVLRDVRTGAVLFVGRVESPG